MDNNLKPEDIDYAELELKALREFANKNDITLSEAINFWSCLRIKHICEKLNLDIA
ncbi:MAG: hypothetical protein HC908_08955 [Calothrix sp. SM1_7_51]|nr:hypothetical protein [Calothrix sp. SM1_7_51]